MKLGLYVVVSNLERSTAFYERLFQKAPYVRNDTFVGFDVSGNLYGLFLDTAYTPTLIRGTSTVPYIRVNDIEAEFDRVKELVPTLHKEIVREGPIQLFMFADPDGNLVEFFSFQA